MITIRPVAFAHLIRLDEQEKFGEGCAEEECDFLAAFRGS